VCSYIHANFSIYLLTEEFIALFICYGDREFLSFIDQYTVNIPSQVFNQFAPARSFYCSCRYLITTGTVQYSYSVIKKDGLNFVRLYFLNYTRYVNDLYNIWKRRSLNFQIPPLERSPNAQPCSNVS
jgi:hypothetical protein